MGIREQQKTYPVTALCRVMQVSSSAFYAWTKRPETSDKTKEKTELEAKVLQIFDDNQQLYGSRRISKELKKAGINAGRYQVRSLMIRMGLEARYPKRFTVTTDSNHNEVISPNTLNRNVDVDAPNRVWATDITYVWTLEGWLYVAVVIDLFSRPVVGWAIDDHMRTSLCVSALQMAFLPIGHKGGGNQNLVYFIIQIGGVHRPAKNTAYT